MTGDMGDKVLRLADCCVCSNKLTPNYYRV